MKKITFLLVFISVFGYSQIQLTDANIQTAEDLWVSNPSAATTNYRVISDWDISQATDMSELFRRKTTFNDDVSNWDVRNVTNMSVMFSEILAFNQDISAWNVSSVNDMLSMFNVPGISTDNYDNILIWWSQQALQLNVVFGAGNGNYCNEADARQRIIETYGWTITDGGLDCATLGLQEENLFAIAIYPNPTNNTLFISGNESPIVVSICNV